MLARSPPLPRLFFATVHPLVIGGLSAGESCQKESSTYDDDVHTVPGRPMPQDGLSVDTLLHGVDVTRGVPHRKTSEGNDEHHQTQD